jgi:diguanylate cyclase (GGDEF)-like protein/PAS domain S-box-containing protein
MTAKQFRTFRIPPLSRLSPLTIVLVYALVAMLWTLAPDRLAEALTGTMYSFRQFSIARGVLFILLTSTLLHLLIRFFVKELRTTGNILQAAFQASPDAITIKRLRDGVFLKINSGFTRTFGYSEAEAIGRTATALELWDSSADRLRLDSCLEQSREVRDFNALFRTSDGKRFRGTLTARRVKLEGEECLVTIVRDRTAELEAREEAEKLANYDPETGLPNHSLFMDRLERTIGQDARARNKTAIIYISLTGYKAIVDVFGHGGECRIIKPLSRQIVDAVRQHDGVARIRHDEFAVMLGGVTSDGDVTTILNRLQQIFAVPLPTPEGECAIPACMGVACFPSDGLTANIIMQNAHIAMNQARHAGITLQFYSESMNRKAMERFAIETCMLRAIDDGEFFLCYQPKIDVKGMHLIGVEALARWKRPGEGVIPPDRFIAVAEENGMIVRLGGWILREACRQNRAWQDGGLPPTVVSVNISARQLRENSFVEQVTRTLEETGLEPRYLELELTESVVMADSDEIVQKLARLKQLGVGISVDDFGTGYSSLSYLKHLPVDTIKVDRSFVRDIVHDPDDKAIVEAVIAMGHALGLTVIAEGVETVEQLEFLRSQNCNQAQGFYFSKPLDPDQLARFLNQHCPETPPLPGKERPPLQGPSLITSPLCLAVPPLAPPSEALTAAEPHCIGDISLSIPPAHPGDNLAIALKRFQTEKGLLVLPVVDAGSIVGILNRSIFLEEHVIGMHGFAFQINHSKKMRDLMAPVPLILEASTPIEDAARSIQGLGEGMRIDNVCVVRDSSYQGIIDVNRFISAITEINLSLAKGANPLTGLPGNESIQREITNRLASGRPFDIAYIDVDNFKPYNDYYGFQRGDQVIKVLGEIITKTTGATSAGTAGFSGHIGGDDFIVITEPHQSPAVASRIIRSFEGCHPLLHDRDDCCAGCYVSTNRKGEQETFPLLSLSIGIVNTLQTPVSSYGQLASLSTEVKRLAKRQPGSSVVINRRLRVDTAEGGAVEHGFWQENSQSTIPIALPS